MERGQGNKEKENRFANLQGKRLYTLKEAAHYLGRSVYGMRELVWARKIPVVLPPGGRKIYLDKIDLDNFIENNKTEYL